MSMYVHRSNSLEELVDRLSDVIAKPLCRILDREVILIQSAGMERYLSRELARRAGILAGVVFPFPRAFLRDSLDQCLGHDERSRLFERDTMSWVLYDELSRVASEPSFQHVEEHLRGDEDGSRRLFLAERLAHFFDQYVTFRPRMVLSWQNGEVTDDYQAILWQRLVLRLGDCHFASRCSRLLNEVDDATIRQSLPERICLVGGPGLPPLFLQMLRKFSEVTDVHLFSFTACKEYFADAQQQDLLGQSLEPGEAEGAAEWNPLLLSLGQVEADYQHLLLESIDGYSDGEAQFHVPRGQSTLALIQKGLLDGSVARPQAEDVRGFDDSITVDSCHSRLREIEVLHNRLLGWFSDEPGLRPEDVVVLAPDIEPYAPLIDAVFSARATEGIEKIPFRIADRSERQTNPAARAILLGLSLLSSRFKATELLDLLQLEPVRARYGVDSECLEKISAWVREANIRCCVDEEQRRALNMPAQDENTWRFGMRRLMLGFFVADDGLRIWKDVVPLDNVAAADAESLGKLCELCENLFELRDRLLKAGVKGLTLGEWTKFLQDLAACLVAECSDGSWDVTTVEEALLSLQQKREAYQTDGENSTLQVGVAGMKHLLTEELDARRPSTDFLSGGVTFCSLLPLRTIPFLRVCLLGMNQGEFPRSDIEHQLDRMALKRKRGDRSLRADDRYLFLEVLLAAKEKLAISYVGRSIQDNTELAPSVVLSELEDVVEKTMGKERALRCRLHPLQPFSPEYFHVNPLSDHSLPVLRSFDQGAYLSALALVSEKQSIAPFFDQVLPAQGDDNVVCTVGELIRFWKDPAKAYLRNCGISTTQEHAEMEDRERVSLPPLERFQLGEELLRRKLRGDVICDEVEIRRGTLPIGQGGRSLLDDLHLTTHEIIQAAASYTGAHRPETIPLEISIPGSGSKDVLSIFEGDSTLSRLSFESSPPLTLSGSVVGMYGDTHMTASFGTETLGRRLALWVEHLALCASMPNKITSVLLTRSSSGGKPGQEKFATCSYRPIRQDKAKSLLFDLVFLYRMGMRYPLPFLPELSETYVQLLARSTRGKSDSEVEEGALRIILGKVNDAPTKESEREAWRRLYRGRCPILGDQQSGSTPSELPFCRLSVWLFGNITRCTEELA